jgi:hypothetical protein
MPSSYSNPVFPPPSPGVQTAILRTQTHHSPTNNNLRVYALGLASLRHVRIAMAASQMTNLEPAPQWWVVNAYCALKFPQRDLSPIGSGANELALSPSVVTIPSLGARTMAILDLYLPRYPEVLFVNLYFSTYLDGPTAQTYVMGYPDGAPHSYDGMFLTPSGPGVFLRRDEGGAHDGPFESARKRPLADLRADGCDAPRRRG